MSSMVQFIVTNILLVSLGAVLYIVARALPRIREDDGGRERETFLDRLVMSEIPHRVDTALNTYTGKIFRKLKVSLMRFDNYLTEKLKKMSAETNGNNKPKIDFSDLNDSNGSSRTPEMNETVAKNEKIGDNTVSEA